MAHLGNILSTTKTIKVVFHVMVYSKYLFVEESCISKICLDSSYGKNRLVLLPKCCHKLSEFLKETNFSWNKMENTYRRLCIKNRNPKIRTYGHFRNKLYLQTVQYLSWALYFSICSTNDMEEGIHNVISKFNGDLKLFRIIKSTGKCKRCSGW